VVARTPIDADDLMRWVAGKVAPYKKVREVAFVEEIPKSPTGVVGAARRNCRPGRRSLWWWSDLAGVRIMFDAEEVSRLTTRRSTAEPHVVDTPLVPAELSRPCASRSQERGFTAAVNDGAAGAVGRLLRGEENSTAAATSAGRP
jgi:hypothetical protein